VDVVFNAADFQNYHAVIACDSTYVGIKTFR
jgi:hypothetical protein